MNLKYKTIPFIILILFIVSFSGNAQNPEDEFSKNFIKAIASENIDEIVNLKPNPEFWRLILEKETKDMTDEEIIQKANKNEKLILDFDNIIYSAKKGKIDLKEIAYKGSKIEKIWEDEKMPFGLTIKYIYKDKDGNFSLSVYKYKNRYYLSEILQSFDVFNQLK